MSAMSTNKARAGERDTLRPEYRREDLGPGVRGKYHKRFVAGSNLVILEPDVARVFRTPESVNDALRSLIGVAERSTRKSARSVRTPGTRPTTAKSR